MGPREIISWRWINGKKFCKEFPDVAKDQKNALTDSMCKKVDKSIKNLVSRSDTDVYMSDVMKEFEEKEIVCTVEHLK